MPLPQIDPAGYAGQLAAKVARFKDEFSPFGLPEPAVFASAPLEYRLRAEFRVWHHDGGIDYAMFDPDAPKRPVLMQDFPAACATIRAAMPALLGAAHADATIGRRLYAVEFLATLKGDLLITLIYHRRLDGDWEAAARRLAASLGAGIIGRSKGQKVVLARDWAEESFALDGRMLTYRQPEGAFSQPNGGVNRQMLGWACAQAAPLGGDLLELYCGNGNFTVALAPLFDRVLATEMSKTAVHAAQHNLAANGVGNVALVRMASDEISAALAGRETFRRLAGIDLAAYRFSTLFVDPPRSGLDAATLALAEAFAHVLYISCNPETLRENVAALRGSHEIAAAAVFDQFPYTHHMECGVLLRRSRHQD